MALYLCIPCRRSEIVVESGQGVPRCPKCRYGLRYYGREEGTISQQAQEDTLSDVAKGVSVASKTFGNNRPNPAVLDAETQLIYQPKNPEILRFLSVNALADRDWRRAIELIKRYLDVIQDDRDMKMKLVDALLLDHRSHEAEVVLAHYLIEFPNDPIAHYNMVVAIASSDHIRLDRMTAHAEACEVLSDDPFLRESVARLMGHFLRKSNE